MPGGHKYPERETDIVGTAAVSLVPLLASGPAGPRAPEAEACESPWAMGLADSPPPLGPLITPMLGVPAGQVPSPRDLLGDKCSLKAEEAFTAGSSRLGEPRRAAVVARQAWGRGSLQEMFPLEMSRTTCWSWHSPAQLCCHSGCCFFRSAA